MQDTPTVNQEKNKSRQDSIISILFALFIIETLSNRAINALHYYEKHRYIILLGLFTKEALMAQTSFEVARKAMIDSQIRPNKVIDERVVGLLCADSARIICTKSTSRCCLCG